MKLIGKYTVITVEDTDGVSIKERKWNDKDKRRYYVRELVRKGCKQ